MRLRRMVLMPLVLAGLCGCGERIVNGCDSGRVQGEACINLQVNPPAAQGGADLGLRADGGAATVPASVGDLDEIFVIGRGAWGQVGGPIDIRPGELFQLPIALGVAVSPNAFAGGAQSVDVALDITLSRQAQIVACGHTDTVAGLRPGEHRSLPGPLVVHIPTSAQPCPDPP